MGPWRAHRSIVDPQREKTVLRYHLGTVFKSLSTDSSYEVLCLTYPRFRLGPFCSLFPLDLILGSGLPIGPPRPQSRHSRGRVFQGIRLWARLTLDPVAIGLRRPSGIHPRPFNPLTGFPSTPLYLALPFIPSSAIPFGSGRQGSLRAGLFSTPPFSNLQSTV